jgi:hypothetical protein
MVQTRPYSKVKQLWRLWAKALGEKAGNTDAEADRVAYIRTVIVLIYIITNFFIIAGVVRHW